MTVKGKIILITGATAGIGWATAAALGRQGAHVIVHGRNEAKAEAAADELRRKTGGTFDSIAADLSTVAAVKGLAEQVLARYPRLDVLINNAAVIMPERTLTADGLETTWAINHLAYFVLTNALLDRLRASVPARIVVVSSDAHFGSRLDFDNLQGERRYDPQAAYGLSKLCNVLFTYALARRLAGSGVTANVLHPGVISTNLLHNGWGMGGAWSKGAQTPVYLAADDSVAGVTGQYFENKRATPSARNTTDEALQEKLWAVSEQAVAALK